MNYSHKTIIICVLWLFFSLLNKQEVYAGNYTDSLTNALKIANNDTTRIKTLTLLAENCDKGDILKYASISQSLCEKAIAEKRKPVEFYKTHLAGALNNTGYYYSKQGNFNKALENYKASLKIHEEIKDKQSAAYTLNNIAYVYNMQGDLKRALEYYYKNLKVQEQMKDTIGIAYSLDNIGYTFMSLKDNNRAKDYFIRSIKLFEALHDKKGTAIVSNNLGIIYSRQNQHDKALTSYNRSLSLYEELDDQYNISFSLGSIGNEHYKIGNDAKALDYLNRSLEIAEALQIKEQLTYTLTCLARVLFRKNQTGIAQDYALRALQLAKEIGNPKDIQNTSDILKQIYKQQGNYKEALAMHELEISMRDSISNEANKKEIIAKELQYQYEKKELQVKLENEKKIARKNTLVFASLFIAFIIIVLSVFYTRQNNFRIRLQRMELEQQQYRAQMNPHFIFNCLNSIQHYIVHNDVISANKYLSEFASLMRKTLENNKLHAIDLQQEIDYLNTYLMLEQMRFENKFTYAITCAKNINTLETQILPMLIQPFAENAIVHGLCYLEKDGKLSISFEKQGDYLVCKIDDNGIGREASLAIKQESNKKHTSQGMELIKKRLALVSTITKRKFEMDITDKMGADAQPAGTLVVLKFPTEI